MLGTLAQQANTTQLETRKRKRRRNSFTNLNRGKNKERKTRFPRGERKSGGLLVKVVGAIKAIPQRAPEVVTATSEA